MLKKGISGSTLKIIAVIAMIMDHTAWFIFDPLLRRSGVSTSGFYAPLSQLSLSPVLCVLSPLFHTVGRITFPIMLFALSEGVKYSKNKVKYIRNMAIFALLSEIPFNLANTKNVFCPARQLTFLEGQNVFITLTLSLIALLLVQKLMNTEKLHSAVKLLSCFCPVIFFFCASWYFVKRVLASFGYKVDYPIVIFFAAVSLIAYAIITRKADNEKRAKINISLLIITVAALISYVFESDYRFMGVVAAAIIYALRENRVKAYGMGCLYLTCHTYAEAGAFLGLPLIKLYNGKRGLRLKYLFYIAYPAHLLILYGIRLIINV